MRYLRRFSYRVELALSARSACKQTGAAKKCPSDLIEKGTVRIGSFDVDTGSYGRWVHLSCFRVPSKVWLGLPDPTQCTDAAVFEAALTSMNDVLLCGVAELPARERAAFVSHVMNKSNFARRQQAHPRAHMTVVSAGPGVSVPDSVLAMASSMAAAAPRVVTPNVERSMVPVLARQRGGRFLIPVPGVAAAGACHLTGKRFAMTGLFPELGGGSGLNLGKDRLRAMIASFGGRVTASVSNRTDFLIVGKDPGMSKVYILDIQSSFLLLCNPGRLCMLTYTCAHAIIIRAHTHTPHPLFMCFLLVGAAVHSVVPCFTP